jgi:hypothetical protein
VGFASRFAPGYAGRFFVAGRARMQVSLGREHTMAQSTSPPLPATASARVPELIDYTSQAIANGLGVGVEVTISTVCEHIAFGATAAHLFASLTTVMRSLAWPANLSRVLVQDDATGRPFTLCVIVTQHAGSQPTRVRVGLPRELAALVRGA